MEWMQRHHNYVAPSSEEQQSQVKKLYDGKDLLSYPGDVPSLYGRNIARVLWSKELITKIMSRGKDLEYMQSPRVRMSPTRKAFLEVTQKLSLIAKKSESKRKVSQEENLC